jgi:HPt (histidine-containing phosphotransfer) domain-containing protein
MSPSTVRPCVDLERALARLGGDAKILRDAAAGFEEVAPASLGMLREALARRDSAALEFSAHRLRGQAATFDALELVDAIRALEEMPADETNRRADLDLWADAEAAFERVERALREVLEVLRRVADGHGP